MRSPIVSGTFYEYDFTKLSKQLEDLFEEGPGSTPLEKREKGILASIIPHSQFNLSGKCASWAYKEIGETSQPFTYVILGSLHNKISDKIILSLEDFSTPLGTVKNDRNLANRLLDPTTIIDENSHREEHSIEVQLPFLQFVNKKSLDSLRILPILSSTLDLGVIRNLANKLAQIEDVRFIVSSDLIHHGPLYKYSPFKYNAKKEIENITNKLLESITSLNTEEFLKTIKETSATVCGASSIAILLEVLKLKNIEKGKILDHHKSSKEENYIDFASIIYNET
jgi:MEMO1 family protein